MRPSGLRIAVLFHELERGLDLIPTSWATSRPLAEEVIHLYGFVRPGDGQTGSKRTSPG
jgi:hypothetical protein